MGLFLGTTEDFLVGFRRNVHHVAQDYGKLLVDGGEGRPQFMGYFGNKFRFHQINRFQCRDIHHRYHGTQTFFFPAQYRTPLGHEILIFRNVEFVFRDVFKVDMSTL